LKGKDRNIQDLLLEIESLKDRLLEANSVIDAIKEGSVDALVVQNGGEPQIYSIESADYTYRILIEKLGEGALSITAEGLILYCNDYFAKLINLPSEQITGTYLHSYFKSDEECYILVQSALLSGHSKKEIDLKDKGNNNNKVSVTISMTNLQPTVAAIGVVVTDLTQKKKHEEELISYQHELEMKVEELNTTNKNLEQFIHVISHDLKEPLRKILMYSSRLTSDGIGEANINSINVIRSSSKRLDSLVDDIVKFALSTKKDEVGDVDLNEVLKDVADDLEFLIRERVAVIDVDSLPTIKGSNVQMRQLFSNLIVNAIKYGKKDIPPAIKITQEYTDGTDNYGKPTKFLKINIQDNGIGMDKQYLSKIFVIFQRLHLRTEYSGNGIGLSICKKIMENHGGKIEVDSNPGDGSTFSLFFPVTN
jgi:signal transduction histidine kinase